MPTNKVTSDFPIAQGAVMGNKVETKYEDDGVTIVQPSTLANDAAEAGPGFNPDFFPSDGRSIEEQQEIGKGANPSADVVTKNTTTIDPVFMEPSPTADGRVVPKTVPASLPLNAPVSDPSGQVHHVGDEVHDTRADDRYAATNGTLKQAVTKPGKDANGALVSEVVTPAEIVYGDEAAKLEADKANEATASEVKAAVKADKAPAKDDRSTSVPAEGTPEPVVAPQVNETFAPNVAPLQDVAKSTKK